MLEKKSLSHNFPWLQRKGRNVCLITFTLTKHPFSMGLKGFYEQAPRHQSAGKSTDPGAVRRRTGIPATGVSSRSPHGSPQDGKPWRWALLALRGTCLNLLPQEASHDLALHKCLQKQGNREESLLPLMALVTAVLLIQNQLAILTPGEPE